jgi:glycerol-3-phosphate dehydrogenase (NAD(P)+)
MKAAVIGAGSWGSAFARYIGSLGVPTSLWVREPDILEALRATRENRTFLPGFIFPESVSFTGRVDRAMAEADCVFVAVPSHFCRQVYARMAGHLAPDQVVVSLTKGLDGRTLKTMSRVMEEVFGDERRSRTAVLSGPSFAREVAAGFPTAVVVASADIRTARRIQHAVSSRIIRAYTSTDVIGVEVAGAMKNTIAIAAGIIDALKFGLNSRAALITRGLVEIRRLGVALGGRPATFSGLAGIGDLVLTCTGELSRNHWVGQELGLGKKLDEILSGMKMVAEGVHTTLYARRLAASLGVEMPISEQVYQVLYKGKPAHEAIAELMSRKLKDE